MSEFKFQNYALMCMRLAAECRGLAAGRALGVDGLASVSLIAANR